MDRSREARRASIVGSNGFNRRRHRTNSLRDSPDEDGGLDLQESVRLRDRVKKDRDRDRERERDRERDRERNLRERSSRSKRRRAERLTSNRDDTGGDETSEESVNDDEDEEDEENNAGAVRLLTPAIGSINNHHQNHHVHVSNHHHSHSSSFSQQQQQQQHNNNNNNNNNNNSIVSSNNHHLQHRKTFPPSSSSSFAKVLRAPPVWKSGDEMISVPVPRKARSVSKRSHDWISSSSNNNSGGGVSSGGDQNPAQPSSSPARQNHVSTSTAPLPPPTSPSSSNVSIRKKLKHSFNNTTGPKLKPPKVSSSKPSSSNPEELEIEIAEVLYGLMTQSQGPSSSSKKEDSREVNRLNSDAKPLNSPPISNYISIINPILGPNSSPLSAVPPKRKRPRQVSENSSYGARSSPISAKADIDQTPKSEISSPNVEKISRSAAENGCEVGGNSVIPQGQPPVLTAPELITSDSELKPVPEESRINRDLVVKEDVSSSKEQESAAVRAHDSNNRDSPLIVTVLSAAAKINTNLMVSEIENQKEEKFEIDLMEPPPPPHQVRSSPERESKIDLRASAVVDQKPVLSFLDVDLKPVVVSKDNEDRKGNGNDNLSNVAAEEKKCEDAESNKAIENKGRNIDLHLDLENPDRDVSSINENKSQLQTQKQQQPQMPLKATKEEPPTEKPGHSTSSMPLPMSMASWPGGLPPMGYMTPMQGVVSMDGGSVTPAHLQQPLFSQPRPKRCATHCHIARNIHCLHQFMKMNPFWPAPAGSSASLFGSKPCNLNVGAPADLSVSVRGVNNALDKGPSLASVPNGGKEKSYHSASSSDSTQRKQQQILIQQALPPVAPSNLLGPTFIFPLNHQQQSAMAARPATAKPPTTAASSNTTPTPAATTSSPAPTPMSFNYPNMSPNETQYLAILQNNAYPFPIPTVGAPPPNYRGGPAQAMPLFNGSFYSSQIIHHQQLQHSQQPSNQPPQLMQAPHQNASASNNSSPSQKHIQSQQQRPPPQSSGHASLQNNFNSQKAQQSHTQYMHGSEDSSSTNDNRGSRAASMNIYGQNFTLPIHPQSFALMTPPPAALSTANSNQNEKKSHQTQQLQQQQQGLKTGVDSLPPHTFAMSFGPINGTPAGPVGIDTSSMAQNLPTFQNCPEAARQNIQMMAVAAQVAQKNFRISEDNGKSGNVDSSSKDDERKSFSSIQVNSMMESSARSLTVGSGPTRTSRPATTNGMMGAVNVVPNAQVQAQIQQQMLQLKQQQQQMAANAVNRTKVPVTNGSIYSEHLNSSTMVGGPKFPNAISPFPQNHPVHSSSTSPSQSPQWKSSTRTSVPQGPPSVSMHKNIPQQHSRTQHAQISFGGNQKQSATSQGQQVPPPTSNQVGSPTTSSLSKGTSGSPRTTSSASTNNKTGHGSSFSAQPPKNSPSMHSQKSPSILGNPHGAKNQMQQQPQPKAMQQQAQLFFSNPYSQSQSPHSMSTTSLATAGPSGYYMPQRRPDQHQRPPGAPPVSLSNTSTNDPATAIAAATCNVKGRGFSSQSVIHGSPFGAQSMGMMLPAGFSYVHPVQAGVQVKPAEQKQPAGNDSLHQWQPEKK